MVRVDDSPPRRYLLGRTAIDLEYTQKPETF